MVAVKAYRGIGSYDNPWDTPYSMGRPVSQKVFPFHIAYAGQRFIVDLPNYKRTTQQVRRLATDDSVEPGEQSLNASGEWPRGQENYFLGAGQEFYDNRFAFQNVYTATGEYPSVRTRFWRSKGINPWIEYKAEMQLEQAIIKSSASTTQFLCATDDALYWSNGADLYWSTDGVSWTSAGVATASSDATISSITTDGNRVWAACGAAGVFVTANEATSATQAAEKSGTTYDCTFVAYANGRLIGSGGRDLVEIMADGSTTGIYTHPNSDFKWTCAISTPSAILVGGNAGSLAFVGSLMPDGADEGSTISPPTVATTMPIGERINCMEYSAGSILMGTSEGIRAGTRPDSTGVFDINPVITDPGNVLCVAAWHEFVYFGWTYDTADDITASVLSSGLGRADLSQFTQAGVPAYATDVMSPDGVDAEVQAVTMFNGNPYFAVSGLGVYGPTGTVVPKATYATGWIRYGTSETKILVDAIVHHDALLVGQGIKVSIADEFGNIRTIGVSNIPGTTAPSDNFSADLIVGDRFMILLEFDRGTDETQGPTLRQWDANAMVTPHRQDEIVAPIMLFDKVDEIQIDGRPVTQDTLALFQFLKNLEELGTPNEFQEVDGEVMQAYIDQIQMAPRELNRKRNWFQGICTVKFITLTRGSN